MRVIQMFRFLLICVIIMSLTNCGYCQSKGVIFYSLEQLETLQVKQPRKVIIEVYSKDCEWCKKFESEILTNPVIANYLNKYYYFVKAEAFDKSPVRFNNKQFFSTNGFHPLTAEYLKGQVPLSFPTQIFFDEKLNYLNFLKGYNTPQNFEMAISYFGQNYYKTTPWDNFIKSFKGQVK